MIAIMAKRPFAISALNFPFSASGSDDVSNFQPKSPDAADVPADWSCDSSQKAAYATIWPQPAAGTFEMAARPFGMSANLSPADGERYPGNFPVISGVM